MSALRASSVAVTADVVQRLHQVALLAHPEEVCGLLLGTWRPGEAMAVKQAVVVPNAAPPAERASRYVIAPRLILEWERIAQKSGLAIVGFFHSHPDHPPKPSTTDTTLAWPGYVYVIVSTSSAPQGDSKSRPWVSGMAAWTFDEPAASFVEVAVNVEVADDQIEYFI